MSAGSTPSCSTRPATSRRAQGWSPIILDTNGNGRRDEGYVGPNDPVDPTKDKRIVAGLYAIAYNPVDKTIWGTVQVYPGAIVRIMPGDNPPATVLAEYYEVPFPGYGPRGGDIDRDGVVLDLARERPSRQASTGASARVRSTARPRPASTARRAGRSIRSPARNSRP